MPLTDYDREQFQGKDIYRRGSGPAVIVIAEMPGITPKVVEFADRVADLGCTVVLPHLFGEPGRDPLANGQLKGAAYTLSSIVPACISREFTEAATILPVFSWAITPSWLPPNTGTTAIFSRCRWSMVTA